VALPGLDPRIDERRDEYVAAWQEFCRIPTVSGDLEAIETAAVWLEQRLAPRMDSVVRYLIPGYGPVVVGFRRGASERTLLLYNHYDVQPAGDAEAWVSGAFDAEIRDGAMYARGACDDKADITSRLAALELWEAENGGQLPFSLIYMADPCEEVGSPGLDTVLAEHAAELRSDACLWESYLREEDGRPAIGFGCRGSLEISLSLSLLTSNQHPSYSQVLRSAPLEMMRAISSLVDSDGNIAVPGFLDGAIVPDEAARARTQQLTLATEAVSLDGVDPFQAFTPEELKQRFIFTPSMSLSGFTVDPSIRQSIAAGCEARVRFGLIPFMDPMECFAKVSEFLLAQLPELKIELVRTMEPAFSPTDTPFAASVINAARTAFDGEPVIYDIMTGSGPGAFFLEHLGAPLISPTGTLRPAGNMHGFNEHGYLDDYLTHIQFNLELLREMHRSGFAEAPTESTDAA
jgi:acetylornithine deacetylase/succinyl-diaminopimelate desuccinylase-like protein